MHGADLVGPIMDGQELSVGGEGHVFGQLGGVKRAEHRAGPRVEKIHPARPRLGTCKTAASCPAGFVATLATEPNSKPFLSIEKNTFGWGFSSVTTVTLPPKTPP